MVTMDTPTPTETATNPLGATTIKDLWRNRTIAPGGAEFGSLVTAFLPLVCGSASLLVPGNPASTAEIVVAVFRSFAFSWRRLPQRAVVAAWLLRTTWFAALYERKRLKLPAPEKASAADVSQTLFKELNRLHRALLDAVTVRVIVRAVVQTETRTALAKETRQLKRAHRGVARLSKALRKRRVVPDAVTLLEGLASPAPPEIEALVLSQLREWTPKEKKTDLVRAALNAWQWVGVKRILRRFLVSAAVTLCVLVATGFTFAWLAQHGYLTAWFMGNSGRQLAKEMPELAQPARPWPTPNAPQAAGARNPPRTASELYGLTNVWSAKLSFTAKEWKGISPSRIPPVPNMWQEGGTIVLRNPKARRNGLAGVVGIEFNWVHSKLEFGGLTFPDVAARYRGNGTYLNSLFGPKQSFKVDLNKYTKGQSLAGIHTLNYVNAIPDNSYMHDALAQQLFRDLGVPSPRTAFAYLSVDAPGAFTNQPLGLYVLVENVDADFAEDRFGSKTVPIFKPVTPELFKDLGDDWKAYADIYDLKTKATPAQLQRVIQFARLVTSADDAEFGRRLEEFLDIEEFAAFLAGHVLTSSYDGFLANGQNFFIYLDPRSNKFGFIAWDQDHGWGEFGYVANSDRRERASIWQPCCYDNRFVERVLKVESFRAVYRRRLERAVGDLFTHERLFPQIDQLASIIRPAIAAESDFRLKRFDQAVSTNWLSGPRDGQPEGPRAPVHQLKRFITNRVKSLHDQLDGKAEGEILGRRHRQ